LVLIEIHSPTALGVFCIMKRGFTEHSRPPFWADSAAFMQANSDKIGTTVQLGLTKVNADRPPSPSTFMRARLAEETAKLETLQTHALFLKTLAANSTVKAPSQASPKIGLVKGPWEERIGQKPSCPVQLPPLSGGTTEELLASCGTMQTSFAPNKMSETDQLQVKYRIAQSLVEIQKRQRNKLMRQLKPKKPPTKHQRHPPWSIDGTSNRRGGRRIIAQRQTSSVQGVLDPSRDFFAPVMIKPRQKLYSWVNF
jgi:hypothetical protein